MTPSPSSLLPLLLVPACVVPAKNEPPIIQYAHFLYLPGDEANPGTWNFEADVSDGDGRYDLSTVWADVYQEADFLQSFELDWIDGYAWNGAWDANLTWIRPEDTDLLAEFVAYDTMGSQDRLRVEATYSMGQ